MVLIRHKGDEQWFDDNFACVLHHFTQQLKHIRYRVWGRFNLEWAIPNRLGSRIDFQHKITGFRT